MPNVCAHGCKEHGGVRSSAVPQNAVLINSREEDIPLLRNDTTFELEKNFAFDQFF